jgi:hypothetical protein
MESDLNRLDVRGQIKVKIKYKDGQLSVNCLQCRGLVKNKFEYQE